LHLHVYSRFFDLWGLHYILSTGWYEYNVWITLQTINRIKFSVDGCVNFGNLCNSFQFSS
jgi:hypothetical protein